MSSGEDSDVPAAGEEGERLVERLGSRVIEFSGQHGVSLLRHEEPIARHIFSGRAGISRSRTPYGDRASTIALMTQGVDPIVPASPIPLAPSGLTGVGVVMR